MTTETDLLPMPKGYAAWYYIGSSHVYSTDEMESYARANVARNTALLRAEIEALRKERDALRGALKEIRSLSSINLVMGSDPFDLTAMLGDIHQIADAALEQEAVRE